MPRKDLTLSEKITLLDKIKNLTPSTSHRTLEKLTGVPKSTISRVLKNEQELREEWVVRENQQGAPRKRKRSGKEPEVEQALKEWFAEATSKSTPGARITGPVLKTKAEELARKLGRHGFKATDGWFSRWKSRHEIRFKKGKDERDTAEKWKCDTVQELLKRFTGDDIYSASATGLFYRGTPDDSLCYKYDTGSKKAMDRVTVLCCCNMSGGDRRKLLVVGKHMPDCFVGLRMNSLPVVYKTNKNGRMTSDMFSGWLKEWDVQLQHESRRVLLLLDNSHPNPDCLRNIQLEFLPVNTQLQPMDVGIVRNLKTLYRRRLVRYILDEIEENHLQSTATAADVSRKVNILKGIQFVADSWREIKGSTIRRCFALCGWKNPDRSEVPNADIDADVWELQIVGNYEEFPAIDDNLNCYENDDNVEGNAGNREGTPDDEDIKPVTHRDARRFVDGLRMYFMQIGNEGGPLSSLDACADFVHRQSIKYS